MTKDDKMEFEGIVVDASKDVFIVQVENDKGSSNVNCRLSGKIRMNSVRILPGDKVKIEVSVYDPSKGRIIYRVK